MEEVVSHYLRRWRYYLKIYLVKDLKQSLKNITELIVSFNLYLFIQLSLFSTIRIIHIAHFFIGIFHIPQVRNASFPINPEVHNIPQGNLFAN